MAIFGGGLAGTRGPPFLGVLDPPQNPHFFQYRPLVVGLIREKWPKMAISGSWSIPEIPEIVDFGVFSQNWLLLYSINLHFGDFGPPWSGPLFQGP